MRRGRSERGERGRNYKHNCSTDIDRQHLTVGAGSARLGCAAGRSATPSLSLALLPSSVAVSAQIFDKMKTRIAGQSVIRGFSS
ncbi:hypothetical protein J6590_034630 [Homalodisca vitripennis]|nr:hypothetical protein J6590_034630 [Homalodisca vitripennis]